MNEKYKIHTIYIFSILIGIIIILITVQWSQIAKLVEYISFALTLTSLVLAVLAIIYAFYSNSSSLQVMNTLTEVSKKVSGTTTDLTDATTKLKSEIESIPLVLSRVEGKIDYALGVLQMPKDAIEVPEKLGDELAETFLSRTSLLGILALHTFALAHKQKIAFNLVDLNEKVVMLHVDYIIGFLAALNSIGLTNSTMAENIVNIIDINEKLVQGSRNRYLQQIENLPSEKSKEIGRFMLNTLEDYFKKLY